MKTNRDEKAQKADGLEKELQRQLVRYKKALRGAPVLHKTARRLYGEAACKALDAAKTPNNESTANLSGRPGTETDVGRIDALFVLAPALCRFVWWVLLEARKQGFVRLYFLARDGWLLYHIAQIFCEGAKLPIECRYLYCSRYALRGAEYHLLREGSLDYICIGGLDVTFRRVMRRAGLDGEEGEEIARALGYVGKEDVLLPYAELSALKGKLSACTLFMERMYSYAKEKYPMAIGYLGQEGLLDAVPYAMVDSGWTGSIQKSIVTLLHSAGRHGKAEIYYFGMYSWQKGIDLSIYHTYYFSPLSGIWRKVHFGSNLLECVLSSPEGMAAGYRCMDGRFVPVFEKPLNPNAGKLKGLQGHVLRYAQEIAGYLKEEEGMRAFGPLKVTERLFRLFMGHPARAEAKEYGSYLFCDDVIGEGAQTLAAPLTKRELRKGRLLGRFFCRLRRGVPARLSAWTQGSIVLAGAGKKELWHCAFYQYAAAVRQGVAAKRVQREWKRMRKAK